MSGAAPVPTTVPAGMTAKHFAETVARVAQASQRAARPTPARLVAVKPFPGLVTEEEVARQKAALLDTLAADGSVAPVDADAVSVLQYNGPFTLLFRRRNEIAIVVSELDNADATTTAEGEAPVGAEAEEAAGEEGEEAVVSWYDSGVRLY